jgi:hypothetical protein
LATTAKVQKEFLAWDFRNYIYVLLVLIDFLFVYINPSAQGEFKPHP